MITLHHLFDLINSGFEASAGFFVLNHCRVLMREKAVRGLSVVSIIFFSMWGIWNIVYYPSLGQWFSFCGGIFVTTANMIYTMMILYYRRQEQKNAVPNS